MMTGQKAIIHLGKEQTFENYFVCEENQIAYAAARSVAKTPGKQFNPCILYGSTGLGKTHLLKAIGNEIKITQPELKVIHTTTTEIIEKYFSSIRNNNPDELYNNYIDSDIVLIDEFESIYNIPETQRELIKIINTLLAEKKQVVLSASKILKESNSEIQTIQIIQNKWEWSFLSELYEPGFNSRLAFLTYLAERSNIKYPEDTLNYMAKILISNFRTICGFFRKTEMVSKLSGVPVSIDSIKPLMKEFNL